MNSHEHRWMAVDFGDAFTAWCSGCGTFRPQSPPVVGELAACAQNVCCDVRCPEDDCLVWDDWCDWCQVNEEPPGAGADPYGRTAEDWAHHAE